MRPLSKQTPKQGEFAVIRKSKVYDLKDLSISLLHNHRNMLFRSDIGCYYDFSILEGCVAKKIKTSEIGNILNIKSIDAQYQKTRKLVQVQFDSINQLSNKINKILQSRKTNSISQSHSSYKNIHTNYFLKYYHYKSGRGIGCYVFHEPISITLDGLIKAGNLTYDDKIYIFNQIMEVMQFLQELKICHRCITSYTFVFVPKNKDVKPMSSSKKWDRQDYLIKITGFYQSISIDNSEQKQSIIFQNNYTDPNIFQFKTPQFASDLWSVLMLFFEVLVGKIPLLHKPEQLEQQMKQLIPWQRDIFNYYFSNGSKKTQIKLKDLKIRINQMKLTSTVTSKIIKEKQQQEQQEKKNVNISIRERVEGSTGTRKRAQSDLFNHSKYLN